MDTLKNYLKISLLLTALALVAGCGRAGEIFQFKPPGVYTILGRVADGNDKPLANVPVILSNSPTSRIVITLTNADGQYVFSSLGQESYQVVPQKEGTQFSPARKSVQLTEERSRREVNFRSGP